MSDPTSPSANFITENAVRLRDFISSLLRGSILCAWMLVLALVGLYSLKDTLSEELIKAISQNAIEDEWWDPYARFLDANGLPITGEKNLPVCPSIDEMEYSLSYDNQENPFPLHAALYQIDPGWKDKWIFYKTKDEGSGIFTNCNYDQAMEISMRYEAIRDGFITELRAIASEENADIKNAKIDISALLSEKNPQRELTDLPAVARNWLKRERANIKENQESLALLSTFMRLSILGAFGAIIFLIRDFTTPEGKTKPISTYIFRPFLGVFLAIAVFVVDIMAHSVISTSSILQIRPEPLYILALAAGLLSERVYAAIQHKVRGAIDEYAEENKEEKSEASSPP